MAVGVMGYGTEVEIVPVVFGGFYLLLLPYAGSASIRHGRQQAEMSIACGSVLSPDDPTVMQWSANCSPRMVQIDRQALERQLSVMLGGVVVPTIQFDLAMNVTGRTGQWWQMFGLLLESLEGMGANQNTLATSLHESLLLVTLLNCQNNSYSERLNKPQKSIAPRHVRQVEAYIDANADKPLTIADLVEVSGVSARAMFDGFRRFRETSPLAHLRSVRLAKARQQLLTASQFDTVTAVATQWGFYQLGRFSAQYKAAYGETPSDTLRRL
jgi:AraC-like DNA-binding protein